MKRNKNSFLSYATNYSSNWVLAFLLTGSMLIASMQHHSGSVHTSILNLEKVPAFDGTVYPIQKNADWARLKSDEYKLDYDTLLEKGKIVDQPACDLDKMNTPNSSLGWKSEEDILIRNTKISCTVRFAGSYEGAGNYVADDDDMERFVGTHPAQDIKAPSGTPIHAVAHGVVVKVGFQSGWGNYVVLAHPNAPNPKNAKKKTTVYTGYAHMLELPDLEEGDIIKKNKIIGKVGSTGFSTTPHVHFQLDLDEAPYHLYWPFTTAEQKEKGFDFVEAVDNDLGWDNMIAYNADPMAWVEKHLDGKDSSSNNTQTDDELEVKEEEVQDEDLPTNEDEEVIEEEQTHDDELEVEPASENSNFHAVLVDGPLMMMQGQKKIFTVQLLDENKNAISKVALDDALKISIDSDVLQTTPQYLSTGDFKNGEAEVEVYAAETGESRMDFTILNRTWKGIQVNVVDQIEPFASFKWVNDTSFVLGEPETFTIQTVDLEGRVTPSFNGKNDVTIEIVQGSGTLSQSTLNRKDFSKGYSEITVTPEKEGLLQLKLSYGRLEVLSPILQNGIFSDYDEEDPFYDSVLYLYSKGTIQGYPDKSYRPQATVNRAEALKLIYKALDLPMKTKNKASFKDVKGDEWFADIVNRAVADGVIKGYSDGTLRPAQEVNRVEFLKMLIQASEVSLKEEVKKDPFKDVPADSWFAPYVAFANEKNIFPNEDEDKFSPSQGLSRGEIAEALYRMLAVKTKNASRYSSLLKPE